MRESDWLTSLDGPHDRATLLAYADWLDDRGMDVRAAAARALAAAEVSPSPGAGWRLSVAGLDPRVAQWVWSCTENRYFNEEKIWEAAAGLRGESCCVDFRYRWAVFAAVEAAVRSLRLSV